MGSKHIFLNSLTTPGCAHPSNGGELATYRRGIKFPSAEGWHVTGPRANIVCVGGSVGGGCRATHDGGWEYIIPRTCAANTRPLFHGAGLFEYV